MSEQYVIICNCIQEVLDQAIPLAYIDVELMFDVDRVVSFNFKLHDGVYYLMGGLST